MRCTRAASRRPCDISIQGVQALVDRSSSKIFRKWVRASDVRCCGRQSMHIEATRLLAPRYFNFRPLKNEVLDVVVAFDVHCYSQHREKVQDPAISPALWMGTRLWWIKELYDKHFDFCAGSYYRRERLGKRDMSRTLVHAIWSANGTIISSSSSSFYVVLVGWIATRFSHMQGTSWSAMLAELLKLT